jgi:hypothetical protein
MPPMHLVGNPLLKHALLDRFQRLLFEDGQVRETQSVDLCLPGPQYNEV